MKWKEADTLQKKQPEPTTTLMCEEVYVEPIKYYAKCITTYGAMVTLAVYGKNEADASERLHKEYQVAIVLDIIEKNAYRERMKRERMAKLHRQDFPVGRQKRGARIFI